MSKKENKINFPEREKGKLNIYMHVSENSGVGYYRQYLPAIKLRENKLANVLINDFKWAEGNHSDPNLNTLFEIANWADLIIVGRLDMPQFYAQWGGMREFFKIPIIMDTDDNIHHVRPTNPGYQGYHPGSEHLLWNEYALSKVFDAITVSTSDLKNYYTKFNPRIYLLPNAIDIKWWDSFRVEKKKKDKLRIGFIGSAAHVESIQLIKAPIIEILKKYPNVEFVITHIFQHLFNDVDSEIRKRIVEFPWIPLKEWPKGLQEANLDIGIAPLADNLFNRGKSNLRWMEYSAARIPTIASKVEPYLCIKNGVDGILVKERNEWFNALEDLINNPEKRELIAKNARKRIEEEFNIDTNIILWDNVYKEVCKKYHDFFGPKRNFYSIGKNKFKELRE